MTLSALRERKKERERESERASERERERAREKIKLSLVYLNILNEVLICGCK
jgi:hypothetical protein